jgi:hypothetical protein
MRRNAISWQKRSHVSTCQSEHRYCQLERGHGCHPSTALNGRGVLRLISDEYVVETLYRSLHGTFRTASRPEDGEYMSSRNALRYLRHLPWEGCHGEASTSLAEHGRRVSYPSTSMVLFGGRWRTRRASIGTYVQYRQYGKGEVGKAA